MKQYIYIAEVAIDPVRPQIFLLKMDI
jgi:hypothetical protein